MVELFHFNQDEHIEGEDLQERFGLRGRNMVQLAQLKTPIAPGFLIESESITSGSLEKELTREGFNALDPRAKSDFSKAGGKIVN